MMLFNTEMLIHYIIDYLSLIKKIEYSILIFFKIRDKFFFRAYTEKKLPKEGTIKYLNNKVFFSFHGNGVTLKSDLIETKYSCLPLAELGVSFHKREIYKFIEKRIGSEFALPEELFNEVCKKGFLKKNWENFDVYHLPSNKVLPIINLDSV